MMQLLYPLYLNYDRDARYDSKNSSGDVFNAIFSLIDFKRDE